MTSPINLTPSNILVTLYLRPLTQHLSDIDFFKSENWPKLTKNDLKWPIFDQKLAIIRKNSHKVLKKYHLCNEFTENCKKTILEAAEEIMGRETKEKIIKHGLQKIHKFFPVEYAPFLQHLVKKNLKMFILCLKVK